MSCKLWCRRKPVQLLISACRRAKGVSLPWFLVCDVFARIGHLAIVCCIVRTRSVCGRDCSAVVAFHAAAETRVFVAYPICECSKTVWRNLRILASWAPDFFSSVGSGFWVVRSGEVKGEEEPHASGRHGWPTF